MKEVFLTRQELYNEVWLTPMIHLAKEYNLSDNGLRKVCKKHNIPYPDSGYWSKLKFGYKPTKTPLPNKKTANDKVSINIDAVKPIKKYSDINGVDFNSKIVNNKLLELNVRETLHGSIPLVAETRKFLLKNHKTWEDYHKHDRLDVSVDNSNISRALRIFNCLLFNLNKLGYSIKIRNSNENYIISYDGIEYKIRLYEKSNIKYGVDKWGQTREFVRNGKLAIVLGSYLTKEIVDSDSKKLEDNIPKILSKIEEYFYNERIMVDVRRKHQLEWEEQERIKLQIKQAKEAEYLKFMNFYNSAHRWNHYVILKQYYDMISESTDPNSDDWKAWLDWAAKKLDWFNPMINAHDELLNNIDKSNLK